MSNKGVCSVVVSVYNEHEVLNALYNELVAVLRSLNDSYEIIFVNDGSSDNSLNVLQTIAQTDSSVKVIDLSRNFGHEAAMIAGIDNAAGDYIICMDSDLQHPPTLIPEIIDKFKSGYEVITMVRQKNKSSNLIQEFRSKMFYRIVNRLSNVKLDENASDFFAISQKVAEILRTNYRERTRFLRGIIQIVGFNKTSIEYIAQERFAGKSKYSFFKLLRLSVSAMSSFSKFPLQLGLFIGALFVLISLIMLIYSLVMWFLNTPVSGYTTLIVFLCAFAGIQLFVIGLIGIYIGNIFDEIKNRPIYLIKNVICYNNSTDEK